MIRTPAVGGGLVGQSRQRQQQVPTSNTVHETHRPHPHSPQHPVAMATAVNKQDTSIKRHEVRWLAWREPTDPWQPISVNRTNSATESSSGPRRFTDNVLRFILRHVLRSP